jgi:hypothetical protein
MKGSKLVVLVLIFLAFACAPGSAKADNATVVGEWEVSGSLTITGTNSCPPAPACAETVSFSFEIADVYDPNAAQPYLLSTVSNSGTFDSVGPLGQFSMSGSGFLAGNDGSFCGAGGDCNRISISDQFGNEIDLHVPYASGFAPFTPEINAADLFECGGGNHAACVQEFFPQGECCMFNFGEVEATVTPVAEPRSLLMLAAGLFALGMMAWWRRQYC